jgi:hypothetical protein
MTQFAMIKFTMAQSSYIELHARSAFSFLEGVSVPEELIAAAAELGMPALALLDRDGVYGAPRFHLAGVKQGIKAHVGAEITVQSPRSKVQGPPTALTFPKLKFRQRTLDFGPWTLDFFSSLGLAAFRSGKLVRDVHL